MLAQSEVPQPESLKGIEYDYASRIVKGNLPFDQFTSIKVKKGDAEFSSKAYLYEVKYKKGKGKEEIFSIKGKQRIPVFPIEWRTFKETFESNEKRKEIIKKIKSEKNKKLLETKVDSIKEFKNEEELKDYEKANRGKLGWTITRKEPERLVLKVSIDTALIRAKTYKLHYSKRVGQEYDGIIDSLEFSSKEKRDEMKKYLERLYSSITIEDKSKVLYKVYYKKKGNFPPQITMKSLGDKGEYLKGIVPPLKPGRLFDFVLLRKFNNSEKAILFEYLNMYINKLASLKKKGIKDDQLVDALSSSSDLKSFYEQKIAVFDDDDIPRSVGVRVLREKHKNFVKTFLIKKLKNSTNPSLVPSLKELPEDKYFTKDQMINVALKFKSKDLDLELYSLWMTLFLEHGKIIDSSEAKVKSALRKVLEGTNYPNTSITNYALRAQNLKKNTDSLKKLKREFDKLLVLDSDLTLINFNKKFLDFLDTVEGNYEVISAYHKILTEEIDKSLFVTELVSTSTRESLKTENSQVLVPDFGFVNAFAHNQNGEIIYFSRPYFGVNYHFGGINRDQRLRQIVDQNFFRHNLSLSVGVTLGNIDSQGYTDYFNGISPMVGFNCRLSRQFRIGVGTLFLRERNQNPIINETNIQIAPYVNVSLDFGLFEQAGKILGNVF